MNGAPKSRATESVAGESVAATESDITSTVDGKGGVNLGGLSINDAKQTSLSQSDRLKRYVESGGQPPGNTFGGSSISNRGPREDDAQSVSTGFASQAGPNNYE